MHPSVSATRGWWPLLLPAVVIGLLAEGPAAPPVAAEFHADPRLRQQFEYDTNITLRDDGDDAFGSRTLVGLLLGVRTPAVELALDSRVRVVRFASDRDLDSEDIAIDGSGHWEWRRSILDLEAGVLRDTTREVLDEETGQFIDQNLERLTFDVGAALSHRFTPLHTGAISLNYRERWFPQDRASDFDLEDFSSYSATGSWTRQVSRALSVQALLGGSWFDSSSETSVAVQGQLGADYALTPAFRVGGTAGPTLIDTDRDEGDSGLTVGALWDLNAVYQPTVNAELAARFFQSLDPQSSGGALNVRTGLQLEADYGIARRTSLRLPALIQRQDPIEDDVGASRTRYFARVQPTLRYELTPRLGLETSYRFRWQTFDGGDDDGGSSHAVLVSLAYDLPGLLSSR